VKIVLAGESFDYDGSKVPMSEALAIERVYERRYAEWQSDLAAGSAKALCVLAWLIWRRDGRDVPFGDILDGTADFDLMEMMNSLAESAEAETPEKDPTVPSDPAGTPGIGTGTLSSLPASSGSARGKSGSSTSRTEALIDADEMMRDG
jgi:hypothetical protein